MMSKKKFDIETSKRILESYKKEISESSKKNTDLYRQYNDLKTTLSINQKALYDFIKSTIGDSPEISDLISKSEKLWEKNEALNKEKKTLEIKVAKLQEIIEDTPTIIQEEQKFVEKDIVTRTKIVIKKEKEIERLKKDLDKSRREALFKTAKEEVIVTDPTKNNMPLYQELSYTKLILQKVTSLNNLARTRAEQLIEDVNSRQRELESLRKAKEDLRNGKITENGTDKKNDNDDKNKSNINKQQPKPESGSSDEDYDDSKVDDSYLPREECKTKQKQLELLKKQYNEYKEEQIKYEKAVELYKKNYNEIKRTCNIMNTNVNNNNNSGNINTINIINNNNNNSIINNPRISHAERKNDLMPSTECETNIKKNNHH